MNFHADRLNRQGRAKYVKKRIIVEVKRPIKGELNQAQIELDYEKGIRADRVRTANSAHFFRESDDSERVLFLRKTADGRYTLVIPGAELSPTDVVIQKGMVSVDKDERGSQMRERVPAFKERVDSREGPLRQPSRETKTMSVDEYITLIKQAM